MTIDQLLGCSVEELAAMSDAKLLEYFAPVLHITRPELAAKEQHEPKKTGQSSRLLSTQDEVRRLAKQLGMNLPI